jgi:ribosomal protein L11 methyltransferase
MDFLLDMQPTLQFTIHTGSDAERREQVVAALMVFGFDAFVEEEEGILQAGAAMEAVDLEEVQGYLNTSCLPFSWQQMMPENWNAVWESSFSPILVADKVAVRASFHEPVAGVAYELIITPKMSFGTGHHATTWLMLHALASQSVKGKTVVDFGTGTGVLAILACKMGAAQVVAIDDDEWSIANARENMEANDCAGIQLQMADTIPPNSRFNLVLANINKHVITGQWQVLRQSLLPGGILLLSGLLTENQQEMEALVLSSGMKLSFVSQRNGWLCLGVE